MINFFKKLFGFKTANTCPNTPKETVAEILTPQAVVSTYVAPAKPANKKVKAISAPIREGKAKGGNGVVKQQPKQSAKPQAPKRPKPKAKRK